MRFGHVAECVAHSGVCHRSDAPVPATTMVVIRPALTTRSMSAMSIYRQLTRDYCRTPRGSGGESISLTRPGGPFTLLLADEKGPPQLRAGLCSLRDAQEEKKQLPRLRRPSARIGAVLVGHEDAIFALVSVSLHGDDGGRGRRRSRIELRTFSVRREDVVEKLVDVATQNIGTEARMFSPSHRKNPIPAADLPPDPAGQGSAKR